MGIAYYHNNSTISALKKTCLLLTVCAVSLWTESPYDVIANIFSVDLILFCKKKEKKKKKVFCKL